MWAQLETLLINQIVATFVFVLLGGLITLIAAWKYYKKVGNELRNETELLRKANIAVVYMLDIRR